MSTQYEITATLEVAGDEDDYPVRATMRIEPGAGVGGGWGAVLDGDIEARINGEWTDVDVLHIAAGTWDRLEESLAELAFDDDGGADEADYRDE